MHVTWAPLRNIRWNFSLSDGPFRLRTIFAAWVCDALDNGAQIDRHAEQPPDACFSSLIGNVRALWRGQEATC